MLCLKKVAPFVLMVHCLYSAGQSGQGVVVLDNPGFPYVFELDPGDSHLVVRTYNGKEVKKQIKLKSVKLFKETNYALPSSVPSNNFYQCEVELEIEEKPVEVYYRPYQMPVTLEGLRIYVENIKRWDETALFEKCGDMSREVRISVCMEDEPWGPQNIVFPINDYVWRSAVYNNTWSALVPFNTLYYHRGEDYGAIPDRLNVVAPVDGVITASPLPGGDGQSNALYVMGDNGLKWRLSHMNTESINPECVVGKRIQAGMVVGKTGMTWAGRKSQKNDPHLHVAIDIKGLRLASFPYLMEAYMRKFPDTAFAIAGGYRFAIAGQTVELDAGRSFSRDGQPIKSFRWKLSNGKIVKHAKTKIVYDQPGIYAEELQVESSVGAKDRDFLYVKVFDPLGKQEYAAGWAYYYPLRGIKPGTEVLFWNRLNKTTAEVKINFGDNDAWYPIEKEITHRYGHAGRYVVSLRSAGPAGEPVTLKMEVLVEGTEVHSNENKSGTPFQVSGIYPHLAYYNKEGECGTGAVVPWADRLWVITYGPHLPYGSSDKLYEITPVLEQIMRKESIGGTMSNRMIHRESKQLFIGPYSVDSTRNVRVIPYSEMPGRYTGNARHLLNPAEKIYYGTMEEGFYEVNVHSMKIATLYEDGNIKSKIGKASDTNQPGDLLKGAHGKGLYSGQGVLVYSNNGEPGPEALEQFDIPAGSLSEWDGHNWKMIRRNQFTEITGPGGIYGNSNPATDPIWATGWDHKAVLLGVRNPGTGWSFYRLPKASHSYDGAHGWNTEWPRIRDIGKPEEPEYLMTMHGMFWHIPEKFSSENTAGIRPRSAYLKVIGDFTRWNDQLIFGCDDSANKEFLNKRKTKGNIAGPGQSNSNLWFTSVDRPDKLGPTTAEGAVWISEKVNANQPSDPFLFNGWEIRSAWINNEGRTSARFTFQIDRKGNGNWSTLKSVKLLAGKSVNVIFDSTVLGEWIRVLTDISTQVTVHFFYAQKEKRTTSADALFQGLAEVGESRTSAGLLWGLGDDHRTLGILAGVVTNNGFEEAGYYELDGNMRLIKKDNPQTAAFIRERMGIPKNVVMIDDASVLIVDDKGHRWRLPKGDEKYSRLTENGMLRLCREVVTERDLFNCAGTFYELPAENADGYAKIRPIASHNLRIHDYASYRGMLIMTGINLSQKEAGGHIFVSEDGKASVWAGTIDDLWKLGKPVGQGGPWKSSKVIAGEPSDPYLIGFYDERKLTLSHESNRPVTFKIEVEPIGHGPWMEYKEVTVKPGESFEYIFPRSFQSRWIRFIPDKDCRATAWLVYK